MQAVDPGSIPVNNGGGLSFLTDFATPTTDAHYNINDVYNYYNTNNGRHFKSCKEAITAIAIKFQATLLLPRYQGRSAGFLC